MYRNLTSSSASSLACVVIGAGGHAKVVIDAMLTGGRGPYGAVDSDPARWGQSLLGVKILGGDELLPSLKQQGIEHFTVGVGSVGSTTVRRKVFERACALNLKPHTVVHPAAFCSGTAEILDGCHVLAGAIVGTCAVIGENSIINSGAIVEHDCQIGPHVHISTGVRLAGEVHVEQGVHIGIGATIRQGIRIGAGSVIGAGAVIVQDVPADVVVVGVPGRIHKRLAA